MPLKGLYDSELFSTQQEGIGTIWLIATLGSKSNHRRVARKEVASVSIPKVCQTICHPAKELALRFASNLLYGVALVYKQQIEYFYTDTTLIRTRLSRDLYSTIPVEKLSHLTSIKFQGEEELNRRKGKILAHDDEGFNIEIGMLQPELDLGPINGDVTTINLILNNDIETDVISKQLENFEDVDILEDLNLGDMDDGGFVLDFGDLERRSKDNSRVVSRLTSRLTSRQVTPFAGSFNAEGGDIILPDFDFGNDFEVEQLIQNKDTEPPPLQVDQLLETTVVGPLRKMRKVNDDKIHKIEIDNPIHLTTADLREFNDDYIANQVLNTSMKYRNRIACLNSESFRISSVEAFEKTSFRFKMAWGKEKIADIEQIEQIEQMEHQDLVTTGRRSSSVLSVERARRMSHQSHNTTRSRSNSDFFQLLSQRDYLAGIDLNEDQYEPDFEVDQNMDTPLQIQEESGDLVEFIEYLDNLKNEMVANSLNPIVKFDDLLDSHETKKAVVKVFVRLLGYASLGKCQLRNLSNGGLEINLS